MNWNVVCVIISEVLPLSAIYCGGYSGEDPPLPIPNREVKLTIADGTDPPVGRVGSCRSSRPRTSSRCSGSFRRTAASSDYPTPNPSLGEGLAGRSRRAAVAAIASLNFRRTSAVTPPVAERHPPVRGNATFISFRSVPSLFDLQASLTAVPARRLQPPSPLRGSNTTSFIDFGKYFPQLISRHQATGGAGTCVRSGRLDHE